MKFTLSSACTDRETQKEAVQLLGKVFPDYWEQIARERQQFPFEEISFAARAENGALCGHVGVMPFLAADGSGGTLKFAGIASVAVDPAFRGMGIAAELCETAAGWASQNGFDALPLFTGKSGVYAHHGWNQYAVHPPRRVVPRGGRTALVRPIPARNLSGREKERIATFYDQSFSFPGKVVRTAGNSFHGWNRIFREPEFEFLLTESGYALIWGGAVVEVGTVPGAEAELLAAAGNGPFTLALPARHPAWRTIDALTGEPEDVYHGEGVMIRPLRGPVPQGLYFPCADKF